MFLRRQVSVLLLLTAAVLTTSCQTIANKNKRNTAIDGASIKGWHSGNFWFVTTTDELLNALNTLKANLKSKPVKPVDSNQTAYEQFVESSKSLSKISASGGTILLAPGVYQLQETIKFVHCNQITIQGSGWSTIWIKEGPGDAIVFEESSYCSVKDMKIVGDQGASEGSGIVFKGQGSSCALVDHCRIRFFAQSGIWFEATPARPMSSNTVSNCHLIGNRTHQIYSLHNNDFFIRGNQFGTHQSGQYDPNGPVPKTGIFLDHCSAGTYSQNYHWDNEVAFRMSGGCNFNRIENNRFEESRQSGIVMGRPDDPFVSVYNIFLGNTIHSNSKFNTGQYNAVECYYAVDITFCNNQIFSWNPAHQITRHCLFLGEGCGSWIIKDNFLRDSKEKSLLIQTSQSSNMIEDNIIAVE